MNSLNKDGHFSALALKRGCMETLPARKKGVVHLYYWNDKYHVRLTGVNPIGDNPCSYWQTFDLLEVARQEFKRLIEEN
jgi:hypothetical protein